MALMGMLHVEQMYAAPTTRIIVCRYQRLKAWNM